MGYYRDNILSKLLEAAHLYMDGNNAWRRCLAIFRMRYNAYAASKRTAGWRPLSWRECEEWMYRVIVDDFRV